MPLYDYKCTQCGKIREIRHGFDESHDESCPACGAALRRVFNPAPIVFKGSGFYVNDSRRGSAGSIGSSKSDVASEAPATDAKPAAESKPTEPKATESKPADSAA